MASNAATTPDDRSMRSFTWVITSEGPVTDIEINIPGVTFVDFDVNLGREPDAQQPAEDAATAASPPTTSTDGSTALSITDAAGIAPSLTASDNAKREIARVTVTSDSEELLDGLEVVPLDLGRLAKGLRVRVKNEAAELKGSLMAQVYVNSKNTVRTLDASMAACVVGEDVLVHDAPTETLSLIAHNSSDLFVSSDQGFSLDALTVAIDSHATIQLSAPSIVARNGIGVTSWWNGGSALVATEAIVAKEVNALAIVSGDVVLQTARLMAEKCFTAAAISGSSRIVGEGIVMEQMTMAFWSSVASSPGVIARKVEAFVGLTGAAIVHAAMHLEAYQVGAATVEYVGEEPELVKSDSWLSWLDTKRSAAEPFVRPASQSAIAGASESRQLRELPVREPVPFHVRVKKAKIPELQNLEGSSYRAKQLADIIPTVGILAVGALGILSFRRRRLARLAKQAA